MAPLRFRFAFAILLAMLIVVVGTYRRRAQAGRRIDASGEGRALYLALRLGGLALWGYCFVYILYPRILGWSFIDIPPAVRWMGGAAVLVLLPFVAYAQRSLGRNVSPTVMTHEDHELVTGGPYRRIRNPLYVSGLLIFSGLGLLAASWFLFVAAGIAFLLVALRLPKEEAELEARFGEEYRKYVRRTGRFLPRWKL